MKLIIYNLILLFSLPVFLPKCSYSDVPLSTIEKLPDQRLVGIWFCNNHGLELETAPNETLVFQGVEFQSESDGTSICYLYTYNKAKNKVQRSEAVDAYFQEFMVGNVKTNFISIGDDDKYFTLKFRFIHNGSAIFNIVAPLNIEGKHNIDNESSEFGSEDNYIAFVRKNFYNPSLYSDDLKLEKVPNEATLENLIKGSNKAYTVAQLATLVNAASAPAPVPYYDSNQLLQNTYYYSYYDVYQIQKNLPDNSSCITISKETIETPGGTKVITEYKPEVYIDNQGSAHTAHPTVIRREERIPSTYSTQQVYKNTCPNTVTVKAIQKFKLTSGKIQYEDNSYVLEAGETLPISVKYVNNYDAQTAEIGSIIAYKNNLSIDPATYDTYVNNVANNPRGTLVIYPTSSRTRIYLEPGDKVTIKARDSVTLGMFAGSGGPDGINGFASYSTTPNAKHGSLIYSQAGSGWNFVGSNGTITAQKSDILKLTMNDNSTDDDSGQFIVEYEIIRAK